MCDVIVLIIISAHAPARLCMECAEVLYFCLHVVSLLAEDDTIANTLTSMGIKTQTIKEVQQAQPNPIQVLTAKVLGMAYQSMGKVVFN